MKRLLSWARLREPRTVAGAAALLLLTMRYAAPLFLFDAPLGYDPGFYRYLFLRHAEGWPPFVLTDLPPWARGHPLGLFFFTSPLLRLGLPVDWLTGWIWNAVPVALGLTLAAVTAKRQGWETGVWVLIAALLSAAYYDGFAAMYWKTYAALFWCVLTFFLLERRSLWAAATGILTLATHHQTGLLFALSVGSWLCVEGVRFRRGGGRIPLKRILPFIAAAAVVVLLGALAYLPIWQEAIAEHLPRLLSRGDDAPAGSFPPASFYVRTAGVLLLLGAGGFLASFRRERGTLWQCAVLWSALFVVLRLFFHRRFFLQLDFFLLPFAALALHHLWRRFARPSQRALLLLMLAVQLAVSVRVMTVRGPVVDADVHQAAETLAQDIPPDATVLALENRSAVVLRGWLPYHDVGGPGLFASRWSYAQWERFLLGTREEREQLASSLPHPTYLFVTPFFRSYYGERADALLRDPCIAATENSFLYRVRCTSSGSVL